MTLREQHEQQIAKMEYRHGISFEDAVLSVALMERGYEFFTDEQIENIAAHMQRAAAKKVRDARAIAQRNRAARRAQSCNPSDLTISASDIAAAERGDQSASEAAKAYVTGLTGLRVRALA